jgi:hypothetical protein
LAGGPRRLVEPRAMRAFVLSWVLVLASIAGCGSAGPYGYARTYEPLGDERPHLEAIVESSYEEVRRARAENAQYISWFGVVTAMEMEGADTVRAALSLRVHQDRHLCSDGSSGSCRVTISEREIGTFTARFTIHEEDREGARRLWNGSLIRVYGRATGETDASGGPVIAADYYRHWPVHTFVLTSAASSMRR